MKDTKKVFAPPDSFVKTLLSAAHSPADLEGKDVAVTNRLKAKELAYLGKN